ncbi:MAG: ABC transporter ATP-binding protein [Nitrospirae bacterium]|nr:ABC transporter ATP-binding protein [Nitrospirota bacterium]
MIRVSNLTMRLPSGGRMVTILDGINLKIPEKQFLAVVGIGVVFQTFHLIPTLTAFENVKVPLELRGDPDADKEALRLLEEVGLSDRKDHYPVQLSGGEQQRVAIARAFIGRPALLLADEPTGNLDTANGQRIIELLLRLHHDQGSTFILVTHDPTLAIHADRILTLRDGRIVDDREQARS